MTGMHASSSSSCRTGHAGRDTDSEAALASLVAACHETAALAPLVAACHVPVVTMQASSYDRHASSSSYDMHASSVCTLIANLAPHVPCRDFSRKLTARELTVFFFGLKFVGVKAASLVAYSRKQSYNRSSL
jgi:hypothetical protein